MGLYKEFCEALSANRSVASNGYLQLLASRVQALEKESANCAITRQYCLELAEIVRSPQFPLSGMATNKFVQLFGEAQFASHAGMNGLALSRVPESKKEKRPDFSIKLGDTSVYFEVKTLSTVDGSEGIEQDLGSALNANIDVERQLEDGNSIAFGVSELQSYQGKTSRQFPKTVAIETILEKIRGNIKSGQYAQGTTFLVVDLSLIAPALHESKILRPFYFEDYTFKTSVSGDLWMIAFSRPGMLIMGSPEFEGKPCVESITEKFGVLVDDEYDGIAGVIFFLSSMSGSTKHFGLFRTREMELWNRDGDRTWDVLESLISAWNDELDTNGWDLNVQEPNGVG